MSKGGATININFRGGSDGDGQKGSYPSGGSHGNSGGDRSHGGSGNDGGGYGFSHNNSHGYGAREPSREALAAADRYEARKRQELEELRLAQEINQQNELARQQQEVLIVKEIKEVQEKQKAKNAPSAYELAPQYQEHQRKVAEAWADMHKRLALEKEVIHPQEDKIEFAEQQLRISKTVQELDGLKLNQLKHNAPEVEVHRSKITTTLEQYKNDSNGFHKQIISDGIPLQALHTLSFKDANSVDSRVVDLVFDLLRDNHLPGLKTLDLSGNPRSIGAHQIDKLADSFYSGNNNLETLDISYAYTPRTDLRAKLPNTPVLKERLFKELYSSGYNELVTLIHSVALCNQPLCLTLEAGVLIQSSNPPEFILYSVYSLFRDMNWMGEPESFKTTGIEMLNHIRQVFERAYQMAEKEQLAPPQIYNIGATYKLPHLIDTFTWGITKCLTPRAFSSEDLGGLKDKLSMPYINMNKVYDVMQFTKTKLDTFLCVTEVVGDRIITHDMLNHQAEWKDAFPPDGYFNKNTPNLLRHYKITKQPLPEGKADTKPFDSSCKHCRESQFTHFLNTTTMVELNLSHGNLGNGDAKILAKLLKHGKLPNLKSLDVSNNQITPADEGYFVKALQSINQVISLTLVKVRGFSIDVLKATMKSMLFIAHNNGISTKEMLTTAETIEHCKKGISNVGLNIVSGLIQCLTPAGIIVDIAELNIGSLARDIVGLVFDPVKRVNTYICVTHESVFSVIDENFANCLVGVDSLLED